MHAPQASSQDEHRQVPPLREGIRSIALLLYRARKERERAIGSDLFADPAWDMLLDLTLCHERRRLSVSAVCVGSRVAHATAIRYLQIMIERGLVRRTRDEDDRRRCYVSLTTEGVRAMERALTAFHPDTMLDGPTARPGTAVPIGTPSDPGR